MTGINTNPHITTSSAPSAFTPAASDTDQQIMLQMENFANPTNADSLSTSSSTSTADAETVSNPYTQPPSSPQLSAPNQHPTASQVNASYTQDLQTQLDKLVYEGQIPQSSEDVVAAAIYDPGQASPDSRAMSYASLVRQAAENELAAQYGSSVQGTITPADTQEFQRLIQTRTDSEFETKLLSAAAGPPPLTSAEVTQIRSNYYFGSSTPPLSGSTLQLFNTLEVNANASTIAKYGLSSTTQFTPNTTAYTGYLSNAEDTAFETQLASKAAQNGWSQQYVAQLRYAHYNPSDISSFSNSTQIQSDVTSLNNAAFNAIQQQYGLPASAQPLLKPQTSVFNQAVHSQINERLTSVLATLGPSGGGTFTQDQINTLRQAFYTGATLSPSDPLYNALKSLNDPTTGVLANVATANGVPAGATVLTITSSEYTQNLANSYAADFESQVSNDSSLTMAEAGQLRAVFNGLSSSSTLSPSLLAKYTLLTNTASDQAGIPVSARGTIAPNTHEFYANWGDAVSHSFNASVQNYTNIPNVNGQSIQSVATSLGLTQTQTLGYLSLLYYHPDTQLPAGVNQALQPFVNALSTQAAQQAATTYGYPGTLPTATSAMTTTTATPPPTNPTASDAALTGYYTTLIRAGDTPAQALAQTQSAFGLPSTWTPSLPPAPSSYVLPTTLGQVALQDMSASAMIAFRAVVAAAESSLSGPNKALAMAYLTIIGEALDKLIAQIFAQESAQSNLAGVAVKAQSDSQLDLAQDSLKQQAEIAAAQAAAANSTAGKKAAQMKDTMTKLQPLMDAMNYLTCSPIGVMLDQTDKKFNWVQSMMDGLSNALAATGMCPQVAAAIDITVTVLTSLTFCLIGASNQGMEMVTDSHAMHDVCVLACHGDEQKAQYMEMAIAAVIMIIAAVIEAIVGDEAGLATAAEKIGTSVAETSIKVAEEGVEIATKGVKEATKVAEDAGKAAEDASKVAQNADNVSKDAGEALEGAEATGQSAAKITELSGKAGKAMEAAEEAGKASDKASEAAENALDALKEAEQELVKALQKLKNEIKEAASGAGDAAKGASDVAGDLKGAAKNAEKAAQESVDTTTELANDAQKGLNDAKKLLKETKEAQAAGKATAKDLKAAEKTVQQAEKVAQKATNDVKEAESNLAKATDRLEQVGKAADKMEEMSQKLTKAADKASKALDESDKASDAADAASDGLKAAESAERKAEKALEMAEKAEKLAKASGDSTKISKAADDVAKATDDLEKAANNTKKAGEAAEAAATASQAASRAGNEAIKITKLVEQAEKVFSKAAKALDEGGEAADKAVDLVTKMTKASDKVFETIEKAEEAEKVFKSASSKAEDAQKVANDTEKVFNDANKALKDAEASGTGVPEATKAVNKAQKEAEDAMKVADDLQKEANKAQRSLSDATEDVADAIEEAEAVTDPAKAKKVAERMEKAEELADNSFAGKFKKWAKDGWTKEDLKDPLKWKSKLERVADLFKGGVSIATGIQELNQARLDNLLADINIIQAKSSAEIMQLQTVVKLLKATSDNLLNGLGKYADWAASVNEQESHMFKGWSSSVRFQPPA